MLPISYEDSKKSFFMQDEVKKNIEHMDWLMGPDWYVDETKPYMRDVSESERVRLNLRRNKLRGN